MSQTKVDEFDKKEIDLADIAKALSHPARIRILRILSEMNVCMCGEIVELLPLAQATVSQHLKELRRVGLIKGDIDGPKVCYCINKKSFESAKKEFEIFFNRISEMDNCC